MSQVPRHLAELLRGEPSPECVAWLASGLRRWLEQETDRALPLHRVLGLGGPRLVRADLRRHHLARALELMPGPTSWRKRVQLAEACRLFEVRTWPAWKRHGQPETVSEVQRILMAAREYGPLPTTPEAMLALSEN